MPPIAVGVAAGIFVLVSTELVVNTLELLSYTAAAYMLPPMPTPPVTTSAPVVVEVDVVVLANTIPPVLIVPYTPDLNVLVLSSIPDEYHSR